MRPITLFVGSGHFSKPRTTAEAMARLEANSPYFLTNYILICATVVIITMLSKPSLLFIGALLGAVWLWSSKQDTIAIGSLVLTGQSKVAALTAITGGVIFLFAGTTCFFILGVCATSQRKNHRQVSAIDLEGQYYT